MLSFHSTDRYSVFGGADVKAQAQVFLGAAGGGAATANAAANAFVSKGQASVGSQTIAVAAAQDWESTGTVMAAAAARAQATNSDVFVNAVVSGPCCHMLKFMKLLM